ncbi:MAG: DUF4168 domain-containing protein [Cyanobacteria bacterium P01_H01_bin.130]
MEQFTPVQQPISRDYLQQRRALRREQRSREQRQLTIGGMVTVAVGLFGMAWLGFGRSPANAQGFSETDISQYAEAVLAVEALRQTAYSQTQSLLGGGAVPVVICSEEDTIKTLSPEVRQVAVTFCNEAKSLVESTGLGIQQFNRMVETQVIDPNLSQRVQEELVRLQQPQ